MGDIIGVDPSLIDLLIDSTIVDLRKNKVSGIDRNKYFEELIGNIEGLESKKALPVIIKSINYLLEKLKNLVDLINLKKIDKQEINEFSENINMDELEILETFLKINYPKSKKRIQETCDKIRRRVSRVVKGFQKRKW
jgi:hypothetical protein